MSEELQVPEAKTVKNRIHMDLRVAVLETECRRLEALGATRAGEDLSCVSMCCTCANVLDMSKMIQIRHVPEDVHRILKARAALAGKSLSGYLREIVTREAQRPTAEEVIERARRRGGASLSSEEIVNAVHQGRGERQAQLYRVLGIDEEPR
ncbi:MAG: VOC family protein [Acidimicrobiia bacterium]